MQDGLLRAQPVEQWKSGPQVPLRPGKTGHDTENKTRAGEDSVQTEEMNTVRAENISELIPAARKIEFESCK